MSLTTKPTSLISSSTVAENYDRAAQPQLQSPPLQTNFDVTSSSFLLNDLAKPISQRDIKTKQQNNNSNIVAVEKCSSQIDFKAADHNGNTVAMKAAFSGDIEKFKFLLKENRNAPSEKAINFEQTNRSGKNIIDLILYYQEDQILNVLLDYFKGCPKEVESYLEDAEIFLKVINSDLENSHKKAAIMKLLILNTELTEKQKNILENKCADLVNCMVEVADDIETVKKLYFIINSSYAPC